MGKMAQAFISRMLDLFYLNRSQINRVGWGGRRE